MGEGCHGVDIRVVVLFAQSNVVQVIFVTSSVVIKSVTYYYVFMFQFIRVLANTLLILIIIICVLFFILFSIFRACLDHCFVF